MYILAYGPYLELISVVCYHYFTVVCGSVCAAVADAMEVWALELSIYQRVEAEIGCYASAYEIVVQKSQGKYVVTLPSYFLAQFPFITDQSDHTYFGIRTTEIYRIVILWNFDGEDGCFVFMESFDVWKIFTIVHMKGSFIISNEHPLILNHLTFSQSNSFGDRFNFFAKTRDRALDIDVIWGIVLLDVFEVNLSILELPLDNFFLMEGEDHWPCDSDRHELAGEGMILPSFISEQLHFKSFEQSHHIVDIDEVEWRLELCNLLKDRHILLVSAKLVYFWVSLSRDEKSLLLFMEEHVENGAGVDLDKIEHFYIYELLVVRNLIFLHCWIFILLILNTLFYHFITKTFFMW